MINKVILIGNVGADPEIRTLENGVKVATIRMATTERTFNRETQETREHTEWHRVTLWRGLADVTDRFVRTGSQIYVEGRLRSRDWTDQQGVKRYSLEIVADDMKLLGRKPEGATRPLSDQQSPGQYGGQQGTGQNYGQGQQGYGQPGYGQSANQTQPQNMPSQAPRQSPPQPTSEPILQDDPDDLPF